MKCSISVDGRLAGIDLANATLTIVDALDSAQCISAAAVLETVRTTAQAPSAPSASDAFIGRPITQITATEHYVIKWRTDYRLKETDSRRFIDQRLAQERRLNLHHPSKTWFYVQHPDQVVIANITPRLVPLHIAARTLTADGLLQALADLVEQYFQTAATLDVRLDEGLSNYGLDSSNHLYYLDDDLYDWDRFTGFTQSVGVWLRQLNGLTADQATTFGQAVRAALLRHFADSHWLDVISRQVDSLFYANDAQQERKTGFIRGLKLSPLPVVTTLPVVTRMTAITAERFGVLADIHANYPALQAVLQQLDAWGIQDHLVLGDVVGYGPHPSECIQALQQRQCLVIRGNHDHALVTGVPERGFSSMGRWVLEWTTAQIDDQQRQWLAELPVCHRQEQWLAVHGAPQDKTFFNAYVYQTTFEENLDYLAANDIALCMHGHSHVQGIYFRRGVTQDFMRPQELPLTSFQYGLICPGAVGQPRSRQVGTEFAVFDRAAGVIHFHRLAYDLERTVADMSRLNFPTTLIERLRKGQ